MSDVNDIKKYLDTIGTGDIPVQKGAILTESVIEAGTYDSIESAQAAAGSDLADIAMQIEELIEDARTIIYDSRDQMAMKRADGYWIAHILGALGLNESEKTSMFTMMDTVKELNGESEDGDDDYGMDSEGRSEYTNFDD